VAMVGTVPCTLVPGGQCTVSTDTATKGGPGYQPKKSRLMSEVGKENVGPGYLVMHMAKVAQSRAGAGSNT
jgi:hypothetical protein